MGTVDKLTELAYRKSVIAQCGGEAEVKKHHDAGKLTARERMNALFDEGSFIELDAFVSHRCTEFGMDKTDAAADGVVTGYGTVDGRLVYAYSQDATVIGGALGEMHAKKIIKVMDMALKMGAPIVSMIDSQGARLKEGMDALAGYGDIYMRSVRCSGVVPQIALVMGSCVGGAAFAPSVADFVIMVEKNAKLSVQGPQVVASTSGKAVDEDGLSGAATHAELTGTAQFTAANDTECIAKAKTLLSFLPQNNLEEPSYVVASDDLNRISEALSAIVPDDSDTAFDIKGLIAQVTDDGAFFEAYEQYAKNIVTGFARFGGNAVGIVANQSMVDGANLDMNAADKASRFIRFCDSFNIPVVTFTDVAGYVIDEVQEKAGLARHISKLVYAYAEATVPKVNVIVRRAYGSAYVAMCSKSLGADIVLAWPTAEIAVTAPDTAVSIMYNDAIANSNDPAEERQAKTEQFKQSLASPFEAARRGYVDDVIEPDSTRPRIIAALEMLASKRDTLPAKKHGNMPL